MADTHAATAGRYVATEEKVILYNATTGPVLVYAIDAGLELSLIEIMWSLEAARAKHIDVPST